MSSSFQRYIDILVRLRKVIDLGVICFTLLAALAISSQSFAWPDLTYILAIRIKVVNLLLFIGYCTVCLVIFSFCGFYRSHRLSYWSRRSYEICIATTLITVMLWILRSPLDLAFATDRFLLVFWPLTAGMLFLARETGQQILYRARARGRNLRNVVVVGEGDGALSLAERITKEPSFGYRVVRIIDASGASRTWTNNQ
jgi:FlaA1/EpsC-like NDP-sugar epimerase